MEGGESIELNPMSADISEDVLEENILQGIVTNGSECFVFPNGLHVCHQMKSLDSHSQIQMSKAKNFIMYKCKNLWKKSQELSNLRLFLVRVCLMKISSSHTNADNLKVPGRFTLPVSVYQFGHPNSGAQKTIFKFSFFSCISLNNMLK